MVRGKRFMGTDININDKNDLDRANDRRNVGHSNLIRHRNKYDRILVVLKLEKKRRKDWKQWRKRSIEILEEHILK